MSEILTNNYGNEDEQQNCNPQTDGAWALLLLASQHTPRPRQNFQSKS